MGGIWLWWIIGIVLVVAVIWTLTNSLKGRDSDTGPTAEEILKRRYARGEIDQNEFQQRLRYLRQ